MRSTRPGFPWSTCPLSFFLFQPQALFGFKERLQRGPPCFERAFANAAQLSPPADAKAWSQTRHYSGRKPVGQCAEFPLRAAPRRGPRLDSPNQRTDPLSQYNAISGIGEPAGVAMDSDGLGNHSNAKRARVALRLFAMALASGVASTVLHAQPAYDAAYISETVPSQIEPFTPASASITMQNTGTATWIRGDAFLSTQDPQDNYYWCIQNNPYGMYSGNRVLVPNDVAPNEQVTFNFVVMPLSCRFAATAPFVFRMLSQTHGTFGQQTPDPGVVVATATKFVSQQVPATVPADATVLVTETFTNTTTTTWQVADGYTLGPAGPAGNTTWGVSSVPLPASVAPNANVTFTFYAVVPATVGTYNFQWQMNMPNGTPFGSVSPATSVQVIAAGPPNYEGLWWASPAASESGWGINFAHQGSTIFTTWFTYDQAGNAWWLSMTAQQTSTGTYTGTLFQNTGPPFNAASFNPSLVTSRAVGNGTLTFTDLNDGTFAYTVNGTAQT